MVGDGGIKDQSSSSQQGCCLRHGPKVGTPHFTRKPLNQSQGLSQVAEPARLVKFCCPQGGGNQRPHWQYQDLHSGLKTSFQGPNSLSSDPQSALLFFVFLFLRFYERERERTSTRAHTNMGRGKGKRKRESERESVH